MRRYPPEICDDCEAGAPDQWLTDRLYFCEHSRVIVWRGDPATRWNIQRNMKRKHAAKALEVAAATIKAHCEKYGITVEQGDQIMTIVRQMERKRI